MIEIILEPNTPREEKLIADEIIYHEDNTCTIKIPVDIKECKGWIMSKGK